MKHGDSRDPDGPGVLPLQAHEKAFTDGGRVPGRTSVFGARWVDVPRDPRWVPIHDETTIGDLSGFFLWRQESASSDGTNTGPREIPTWREVFAATTIDAPTTPGGIGANDPSLTLAGDPSVPGSIGEGTRSAFDATGTPAQSGSGFSSAFGNYNAGKGGGKIIGGTLNGAVLVYINVSNPHPNLPVIKPPPPPPAPPGYTYTGNMFLHYLGSGTANQGQIIDYFQFEYRKNGSGSGSGGGQGGGSDGDPDHNTGDPNKPGSAGKGPEFSLRVTKSATYDPDFGMEAKTFDLSSRRPYWPRFPLGHTGLTVQTMDADQQIEDWHPTDPRLPAVNFAGGGACGALVADLRDDSRYDDTRMAHLQSALRVIKKPICHLGARAMYAGQQGAGNGLAIQFGISGQGDSPGGFIFEEPAVAVWSHKDGGCLNGGGSGDKHRIGEDFDGHPINGLHVDTDACFKMDGTNDGPLFFETRWPEPQRKDTTYYVPVHIGFNPALTYPYPKLGGKQQSGKWALWTTEVIAVTTPKDPPPPTTPGRPTTPNDPGFPQTPSGPPPTPPTTPSGSPTIFGTNPRTIAAEGSRDTTSYRLNAVTLHEIALPSIIGRPQRYVIGEQDTRYQDGITEEATARVEKTSPIVFRLAAFGAQYDSRIGGGWTYTQKPGVSRHKGGTASGGVVFTPPEVGPEDTGDTFAPPGLSLSTTRFIIAPGASLSFSTPNLSTGGAKSGFDFDLSSADLVVSKVGSTGTRTEHARFSASAVEIAGGVDLKLNGATSGAISLKANGTTTSYSITMPSAQGGASTVLTNDGSGNLSWASASTYPTWNVVTKTIAYSAAIGDFVNANVTAGSFDVTLPTAVGNSGKPVVVRRTDASGNTLRAVGTGGQTINGAASDTIATQFQQRTYVSDGANWMAN